MDARDNAAEERTAGSDGPSPASGPGEAATAGPGNGGDAGPGSGGSWTLAVRATLHCLTGCAIGEVLGMIIGTAFGLPAAATVALSVVLAFCFGYALTVGVVRRAGVPLRQAIRVALAADTLSIAVMELVDNVVMVLVPGAMDAGATRGLFWGALAGSLAVAFVCTVPVNRWLIGRGLGHAVVHAHHPAAGAAEAAGPVRGGVRR